MRMMKFSIVMPVCILLFSVLVLTTDERSYRYSLATAGSSDSDFNFVTAGDWGCKNDAKNIFKMMKNMKPELYLTLGDYSYEPTLDCWYDIVKSAGSSLKVVVGNHDIEGTLLETLMNKFDLVKQYYSFDYQNAHFLALSSELDSGEDKGQFEFANSDLAKAKSSRNIDWLIVYFHRPLYSGSGSENDGMRDMYHPLFQKYNVDLVLAGHAHNYQRSYPLNYNVDRPGRPFIMEHDLFQYINQSGTVFSIIGTGGESIQGVDKKPYLASIYEGFGCLNIQINGKSLNAEFYTDQGKTIDHFTIMKNQNNPESMNTMSSLQQVSYDRPNS
jgi:predicted phosphodiesterase